MQQPFQIFCGKDAMTVEQLTVSTETLDLMVPVRRTRPVQEENMTGPLTAEAAALLQQQLDERTAQLQRAEERLEKCELDFQEFASAVSHDLQAPLRAIAGFSQFLQTEYKSVLDETADQYIDHVVNGTARMTQLINGLVQFSRISSRGKPLESQSLNEVLDEVLTDLRGEITSQHVVIERGDLPNILGDYAQLTCLFQNLIQNAITFNKSEKPRVCIRAEQVGNEWHICVEDNGIGIEEKNLDKVFSIFRRLHTREEYDGVGVGLAVGRRVVDRHGGKIQLSSEVGVGTKATIIFPAESSEAVC
ncbi:ATP-binding protein [Mariniblastus sp.]|nr:ATP-binding protein [Mariniblastus sp.]